MKSLIQFLRGKSINLPQELKDGNVYICLDTGEMYTDAFSSCRSCTSM